MNETTAHEHFMEIALQLAANARGLTSPNPMVGAVIVKGGEIIGRGLHEKRGGEHAEIAALKNAGAAAKGATLYINLEPCAHFGHTPPCAPAVAAAGIKTVVAAMRDPNPKVSGAGFKILRKAGVEVVTGVLEKQARRLNEFFIKYIITGKPFVILKGAMTLDGKIATARGDSKWITAEAARNDAHELRAQVDAVLVGAETLLHDDPMLTCRLPGCKRQPYRVVLDGRLRTPPNSNFCKLASDGKTIIAALPGADDRKARRLEKAGCRILSLPPDDSGHVSIEKVLSELGALEVASLLVEGGGTVNFSFLRSGCVDKVVVYIAPRLLGGADSKTILGGAGFLTMSDAVNLRDVEISTIGQDIRVTAYPKY